MHNYFDNLNKIIFKLYLINYLNISTKLFFHVSSVYCSLLIFHLILHCISDLNVGGYKAQRLSASSQWQTLHQHGVVHTRRGLISPSWFACGDVVTSAGSYPAGKYLNL